MKSTGVVRKIDSLGRIVLPIELRKTMNIKKKDAIEIFVDDDKIILSAYKPGCMFCGEMSETFEFEGRIICKNCLEKMKNNKK